MSVTHDQFLEAKKQLSDDYNAQLNTHEQIDFRKSEIQKLQDDICAYKYHLQSLKKRISKNTEIVQRWLLKNKHPSCTLSNGTMIHVPRQKIHNYGPTGPVSGAHMTRQAIEKSAFRSWLINPSQSQLL